eukprot:12902208-Alexandrium_andersonii.AAC.1
MVAGIGGCMGIADTQTWTSTTKVRSRITNMMPRWAAFKRSTFACVISGFSFWTATLTSFGRHS